MKKQPQEQLKKALMCCISCILPCGAFDVIRIVHPNGRLQEISAASLLAADYLKLHPKHVLKTPSSTSATVVVVPPAAELHRGNIYFLVPVPQPQPQPQPPPSDQKTNNNNTLPPSNPASSSRSAARRNKQQRRGSGSGGNKSVKGRAKLSDDDQYLSEMMSENNVVLMGRERRRGRVGVWRPHLESIIEAL